MTILKSRKNGFTLIELVISLAILGIIVTPLAGFFTHTVKINTMSKSSMKATQLAQQYLENTKGSVIYTSSGGKPSYMDVSGNIAEYPVTQVSEDGKYAVMTAVEVYGASGYTIDPGSEDRYDVYCNIMHQTASGTYSLTIETQDGETAILQNIPDSPVPCFVNLDISRDSSGQYAVTATHESLADIALLSIISTIEPDKIKIKLQWDSLTAGMNVLAVNKSTSDAAFYLIRAKASTQDVNVINLLGSIKTYNNLYDQTIEDYDINRLYKITVSVSPGSTYDNSKRLAQLQTLKGGDN